MQVKALPWSVFTVFFLMEYTFLHKIIIYKINSGITLVPEAEFRCIMKTVVVHMKSIFMYEKIFCNSGKNTFSQNPPEKRSKFLGRQLIRMIQPVSVEIDRGSQLRFKWEFFKRHIVLLWMKSSSERVKSQKVQELFPIFFMKKLRSMMLIDLYSWFLMTILSRSNSVGILSRV